MQLNLSKKVPLSIAALVLVTVVVLGEAGYLEASSLLAETERQKLSALMEARRTAMDNFLKSIDADLDTMAKNPETATSLELFKAAYRELGAEAEKVLQKAYIEDNPHPTGQKEKLDKAEGEAKYHDVHLHHHFGYRNYLQKKGYYDIFLFDLEGNLVYSVYKELDYATNILTGKWKDSDLGNVYREAKAKAESDYVSFRDFAPYEPSHGAPASFIATVVKSEEGKPLGVLAFQMPIGRINAIMQSEVGMGESGETYLVGSDFYMRSDSRFSEESTILKTKVESQTVKAALEGKTGIEVTPDYRGVPVFSAYGAINFHGANWAVMAEIDESEVLALTDAMRNFQIFVGLGILLSAIILGWLLSRSVTGPIGRITDVMSRLSSGELEVDVPARRRSDEIGQMANALQVFKEGQLEIHRLREEQETEQRRNDEERKATMFKLADELEKTVKVSVSQVGDIRDEIINATSSMGQRLDDSSNRSLEVAEAAERTSTKAETVAAATEQLSASISEIGQQVARSTNISGMATEKAEDTNAKVKGLAEAAQKIGDVVNLINDIAEQTNLLALNATIEAARAGDAGKGFAVVASEVKSLASQTAKATEEIGQQIGSIQAATNESVEAISGINNTIAELNEIAAGIAAAVEEQNAATADIAANVRDVTDDAQMVTNSVAMVTKASATSYGSAIRVVWSANDLDNPSRNMSQELDTFLHNLRGD